jgi:alpha-glucosidase
VLGRRSGDRWFIGGVYAGAAHTAEVPLRIGSGRWLVETLTDGPAGPVRTARTVRGGDALSVDVVSDGGFAAVACRWSPGRTSCDR